MKRTIKRTSAITVIAALTLLMLSLTACGKSEFGVTESTEKKMTINAENAANDAFFLAGTLEVDEGEEIVITSNLKTGSVIVEVIKDDEEQSMDKMPEMDGDPIMTARCDGGEDKTEAVSGEVPAGDYSVKATCLEKATGTIQIEVK